MENINQIKTKINTIIKNEDLVYCDVSYDAKSDNEEDIWLYDLIVYDREEKINQFVSKLNKYAQTTIYKNMDDGDYTIECIIKYKGDDTMICGISTAQIVDNMSARDKFEIVCKIKGIEYEETIGNLINRIKDSEIDDKDIYLGDKETWDEEYMHIIKEEDVLYIEDTLLLSKEEALEFFKEDIEKEDEIYELWIKTTEEEKEIIRIAKECKLGEISIEMM